MATPTINPLYLFTDIDGSPLEDGFIYYGTAGLDPVTNPITVYWDEAETQTVTQPVRTIGGYPSNAGVRSIVYASTDYSISVRNKNGTTVQSALSQQDTNPFFISLALSTKADKGLIGASGLTMATNRLLGRTTASIGEVEEITVGSGLTLSAGSLSATSTILRGYIDGLTMSTAGSNATMTIAAGQATDSTNSLLISLAASISKTTSAWAVGTAQGGLDTGTIANSTWYYFYLIRRPDTGVVDVVFSTNSTSPTPPANYTQFRYIGAGLTNGSAQWVKFIQVGDDFRWTTPIQDFNGAGSTSAALLTCSLPRGRKMQGIFSVGANSSGTVPFIYASDPDADDVAVNMVGGIYTYSFQGGGDNGYGGFTCFTNTSAQIRHREGNTQTVRFSTLGWRDMRGRNA